jgi:hypothetical protein
MGRRDRSCNDVAQGELPMKTLMPWLSAWLWLWLAVSPVWGQPSHQQVIGAQEQAPHGPSRQAASEIPVDDLDRGTPRRTVEGFRRVVQARNYQRAAQYLDFRDLPVEATKSLGPQLARHLKIVMDQQIPIDVDRLSDSPTGLLDDGLPPDVEQLARIDTPDRPVNLRLQRVPREDGVLIWKLSPATEEQVQAWREEGELYLPRLPREKIEQIDNTLPYPADGSAPGTGLGRS